MEEIEPQIESPPHPVATTLPDYATVIFLRVPREAPEESRELPTQRIEITAVTAVTAVTVSGPFTHRGGPATDREEDRDIGTKRP